jgi:hypothetical protein
MPVCQFQHQRGQGRIIITFVSLSSNPANLFQPGSITAHNQVSDYHPDRPFGLEIISISDNSRQAEAV